MQIEAMRFLDASIVHLYCIYKDEFPIFILLCCLNILRSTTKKCRTLLCYLVEVSLAIQSPRIRDAK
jgi:hypothetical protein